MGNPNCCFLIIAGTFFSPANCRGELGTFNFDKQDIMELVIRTDLAKVLKFEYFFTVLWGAAYGHVWKICKINDVLIIANKSSVFVSKWNPGQNNMTGDHSFKISAFSRGEVQKLEKIVDG